MPNWCENTLSITGNKKALDKFMDQAGIKPPGRRDRRQKLDFENFMPQVDGISLYDLWGTKTNPYEDVAVSFFPPNQIICVFNTAWSPPIEWLDAASQMHPHLLFKLYYYEDGIGFKGDAVAHAGLLNNFCEEIQLEECKDCESPFDVDEGCECGYNSCGLI